MRKLAAILFLSVFVLSCRTSKEVKPEMTTSEKQDSQFTSLFIKATTLAIQEDYDKAIELYEKCKVLRPKNAAVHYELSRMYAKKKNAMMAVSNAEKAYELNPNNKWYVLQQATVYRATGQAEKALTTYEELIKMDEKNLGVLYEMANLYKSVGKYDETVNILDKIELIRGKNPELSYQKYMLLMDAGKDEEGLKEIKEILVLDPENGMANLAMAQHYEKIGEGEKVHSRLIYVFQDASINTEPKLNVLTDFTTRMGDDKQKQAETLELINIMFKTHPKDVKSYVGAGDYFGKLGDTKKANEYYEQSLEYSTNSYPILMQLMDNSFNSKDFDKVISISEKALESYPTQPVFYFYQGMGYKAKENYTKAISSFKAGKNMIADDEKMMFEFYSKMGESYNELKEYKKSDEAYDNAMKINGLEPFMLNNYSYFLSLRKDRLEKAAEMSKKCNEVMPNNASFNDTYGWILFQQGKYTEAEAWIKSALNNGGDKSGTVLEHYGDVMSKLKNTAKALEYWKKAKENGEHTSKIDQKIRTKSYVE